MKILLDGYFDRNLGDDLMLTIAARSLSEHELYLNSDILRIDGVRYAEKKSGYDAYLKVTGSGFKIYNKMGSLYRMRDIAREKRFAKVRAAIGCSIDDFPDRTAEYAIKKQLSAMKLVTVRDKKSLDYMRKSLPQVRCFMYPDMLFSLPDGMIPNTEPEGLLGIAVRGDMDITAAARKADEYIEKTNSGVLLLAFDSGTENDAEVAEKVYSAMEHRTRTEIIRYTTVANMLYTMCRCSFIFGARLHSLVLAARMGIPFSPALRSDKIDGALESIGYDFSPDFRISGGVITAALGHMKRLKELLKEYNKI